MARSSTAGTPMPRGSLAELSVVIPFRCDTPDRLDNLAAVLRHLRRCYTDLDLLILEDAPHLEAGCFVDLPGVRHEGLVHRGAFNKARLLNRGMMAGTDRPYVAAYDTDVLVDPDAVLAGLDRMRAGARAVLPYNGDFYEARGQRRRALLGAEEIEVLAEAAMDAARAGGGEDLVLVNRNHPGGMVIVDRAALVDSGGFHEGFRSWGFEDQEFIDRLAVLGYPVERVGHRPLLHLAHARPARNIRWYRPPLLNRRLYDRLRRLSADELRALRRDGVMQGDPGGDRRISGAVMTMLCRLFGRT